VSNAGGAFAVSVVARETSDERWEGSLQFVPTDAPGRPTITTGIETRQHDRLSLTRWASGLTAVYAEGALARALGRQAETPDGDLLDALTEIVEALDRRIPQVDGAGESVIAADAGRLRASAMRRIAALRETGHAHG
jgi:hypothetical protein